MRHWTSAAWKAFGSVREGVSYRDRDGRLNWDTILLGLFKQGLAKYWKGCKEVGLDERDKIQ